MGGRIGSVAAWDEIDGLIQAEHSIQLVRSGDAVNATIIAPYIGSIVEHDSTITTAYPYPTTPDSIKAEVLAEAQAAYDEVLAVRSGIADDITALLADFAAQKTQAMADLAQQQAAVDVVIAEVGTKVQDKLKDDTEKAFQAELKAGQASSEEIAKLREEAEKEKKALEKAVQDARKDANAAYQRALNEKDKIIARLADYDQQMLELKDQDANAAASERDSRQTAWDEYRKNLLPNFVDPNGIDAEEARLDKLQFELDLVGLTPGVGNVADLANAGLYFVRGKLGYASLSLLAAAPLLGQAATVGKLAGKGAKLVDRASDMLRWTDEAAGFRSFIARNFRTNLGRLTGGIRANSHAHHVFPRKFKPLFDRAGVNIHDPKFGAWWERASHLQNVSRFNRAWERFLQGGRRTAEEILHFGRDISGRYALEIFF